MKKLFITEDGYRLRFEGGVWTDGDMNWRTDPADDWPLGMLGRLSGKMYREIVSEASLGWIVLVREHGSDEPWTACFEGNRGKWPTYEAAEAFADAEIGADYVIAEMVIFPTHGATGEKVEF